MKPIWTYPLAWLAVVVAALVLAIAAPRVHPAIGRLPAAVGQTLEQKAAVIAHGEERILALITFHRSQRQEVESWISGLQLQQDQSISWIRMPVINDSGDPGRRAAAEGKLRVHYASAQERSNLVPVFTDRAAFVQSAGLRDIEHAHVLVLNRNGEVLARVAGAYDADKARIVRDTLSMSEL